MNVTTKGASLRIVNTKKIIGIVSTLLYSALHKAYALHTTTLSAKRYWDRSQLGQQACSRSLTFTRMSALKRVAYDNTLGEFLSALLTKNVFALTTCSTRDTTQKAAETV